MYPTLSPHKDAWLDTDLTLVFVVYSLAAVNFCLFIVGTVQVSRIVMYQQSVKGTEGAIKSLEQEVVTAAKDVEKKVEQKL